MLQMPGRVYLDLVGGSVPAPWLVVAGKRGQLCPRPHPSGAHDGLWLHHLNLVCFLHDLGDADQSFRLFEGERGSGECVQ